MSIHTVNDLADAIDAEAAAIANARTELAEAPACSPDCQCQCGKSHCGCRDGERAGWRQAELASFNDGEAEILRSLATLNKKGSAA